jgi:hypothetical protein
MGVATLLSSLPAVPAADYALSDASDAAFEDNRVQATSCVLETCSG